MFLLYLAAASLPSPPPLYSSDTGFIIARQKYETKELMQAVKLAEVGRFAGAAKIYRPLAAQGNVLAQVHLGNICFLGHLGAPDYSCAIEQYGRAARAGFDEGQFRLGVLLENGRGAPKDLSAAFHWYKLAAEQGMLPEAQTAVGSAYYYGRGVARDDSTALTWYKKAVAQQHAPAQFSMGMAYRDGRGVGQDDKEANYYFRAAAKQGYAPAEFQVGRALVLGVGAPKDQPAGIEWYLRSANHGFAEAQLDLAMLYSIGRITPLDRVQAYKWFSLCLANSDAKSRTASVANSNRDHVANKMSAAELAQARSLVQKWVKAD